MSDRGDLSELSARNLTAAFKASGQIPLKVEILLAEASLNSVRATYRAWVYDPKQQESFDENEATLIREEGIAHFFRRGTEQWEGLSIRFIPEAEAAWEHNHNAVSDRSYVDAQSADLDQQVAIQWRKIMTP